MSDSSSKTSEFCRAEVCGHLYGKNSGKLCRISSGEFLCTSGVDTQKKEIFLKSRLKFLLHMIY